MFNLFYDLGIDVAISMDAEEYILKLKSVFSLRREYTEGCFDVT